jgi:peptidoglycan/LPS O-acetylase OafA/YrhL
VVAVRGLPTRFLRIHDALARVTSGQPLIPVVDGLRFVAVSSVCMVHLLDYFVAKAPVPFVDTWTGGWLAATLNRGWFGVDLFFVISGFVISLPFASHRLEGRPPPNLRNYYRRRLTRLEPPFIICITIFFALFVSAKGLNFKALLPHYFATATYSHNIVYRSFSLINPVTWSLEVEIQFYLIAPLIAQVFLIGRREIRRAVLISLIAAASVLQPALRLINTISVLEFMQFFLTGFLLADVYSSDWQRMPNTGYLMDIAGLAALAALYWATGNRDYVSYRPAWIAVSCIGLFVGCCAAFRGRVSSRVLGNPWIVVIGGMCYTIYLYHCQIFSLLGHAVMSIQLTRNPLINFFIAAGLMVPAMLVVSSLLFVVFEKPFMRRDWPSRLAANGRYFTAWIIMKSPCEPANLRSSPRGQIFRANDRSAPPWRWPAADSSRSPCVSQVRMCTSLKSANMRRASLNE